MPIEILRVRPDAVDAFYRGAEREALKTFYGFSVIWHEERHDFEARDGDRVVGAATIRIAASLGHLEKVAVVEDSRRRGMGRQLLDAAADVAKYYNCHKMTVLVPRRSAAQQFFEACGYCEEAILPQHTFKLDMAVLRKFLL